MAYATPNLTLPEIPDGKDFTRDTFWWKFRQLFLRTRPKEKSWDWYYREKTRRISREMPFPPAPVFCHIAPPVPQVWTGEDEKPGRVPRDGK